MKRRSRPRASRSSDQSVDRGIDPIAKGKLFPLGQCQQHCTGETCLGKRLRAFFSFGIQCHTGCRLRCRARGASSGAHLRGRASGIHRAPWSVLARGEKPLKRLSLELDAWDTPASRPMLMRKEPDCPPVAILGLLEITSSSDPAPPRSSPPFQCESLVPARVRTCSNAGLGVAPRLAFLIPRFSPDRPLRHEN